MSGENAANYYIGADSAETIEVGPELADVNSVDDHVGQLPADEHPDDNVDDPVARARAAVEAARTSHAELTDRVWAQSQDSYADGKGGF